MVRICHRIYGDVWKKQFLTVLRRNLSTLIRNKVLVITEIFSPLLLIAILSISINNSALERISESVRDNYSLTPDDGTNYICFASPNNSEIRNLLMPILQRKNMSVKYFSSETEASIEYLKFYFKNVIGIHFFNSTAYALRFPYRMLPTKENAHVDLSKKCFINHTLEHCSPYIYKRTGFAWLQQQINYAILKDINVDINTSLEKVVAFEVIGSHFMVNSFYYVLSSFCLILLFIGLFNAFVVTLVAEKEENLFKFMKIMGLTGSAYYVSWILIYSVLVVIISSTSCLLLLNVIALKYSNFWLLFIFLVAYGLSFVALGLVIVDIFKNSNLAGHVVSSLVIIYSLFFIFISRFEFEEGNQFSDIYYVIPFQVLIICSLFSPMAFSLGLNQIMTLESRMKGLTMETVFHEDYSVFLSFTMLILDCLIYVTLAIFLEKLKDFKLRMKYHRKMAEFQLNEQEMVTGQSNKSKQGFENYPASESVYKGPAVFIKGLYKIFDKGNSHEVVALNDLNLNIFEDEITAVIGHNGAGKTTLLNILTGISLPTSGAVEIYGKDVTNISELRKLRTMIGFSSQKDMIHLDLTCGEHLQFFLQVKNIQNDEIQWADELIPPELKDVCVSKLSVGQKQKLKLAIALIGSPRVLVLDEPTSGMDILARNTVWKILKKLKAGRVIILSTHLMNEADSLADKKAILSNGSIQCCGSSLFLKSHFDVGYHLSLVLENAAKFDFATLLVKSYIPESTIESKHENSIVFGLPLSSRNKFCLLFEVIEKHLGYGDSPSIIVKFSVTMNTLEEVFLKVQSGVTARESLLGINSVDSLEVFGSKNTPNFYDKLLVLVKRKLKDDWRNFSLAIAKLTFPFLFVLCFMASRKLISFKFPLDIDDSPFSLDCSLYNFSETHVNFYSSKEQRKYAGKLGVNLMDFSFTKSVKSHMAIGITEEAFIGLYQESYLHAIPIMVNLISNLILKLDSFPGSAEKILVFNWMWPPTTRDIYVINAQQINQMLYFISFSILTVSSIFPTSIVVDRKRNCIRQIKLANISGATYWLANLISDCLQMVVLVILSLLVFFAGQNFIVSVSYYFLVLVVVLQYVPALLLFSYFITFFCSNVTFVQFYTPVIFYSLSFGVHFFFDVYLRDTPFLVKCIVSTINPPYGIILAFDSFHLLFEVLHYGDANINLYYYFSNHYFNFFVSPWINVLVYFALLTAFEKISISWFLNHIHFMFRGFEETRYAEDNVHFLSNQDAAVNSNLLNERTVISAKHLTKVYMSFGSLCLKNKKKVAVSNASFDILKDETLGLLGPNGAGKSTLVGMIVNSITPTKGQVEICGKSRTLCGENIFSRLSFCPQENSCWDNITILEHLNFFLNLRRIRDEKIVDFVLEKLELYDDRHKLFKNLSLGNKRKLCFAISQLFQNEAIVLDEPTAGLDPISRKSLWRCHKLFSKINPRGVLLSTHSVEEAEFLCDKLAIIIKGQIFCTGLTKELKDFSDSGYTLEVKLKPLDRGFSAESMSRLKEFVSEVLIPGSEIINECYDWIAFKTPRNSMLKLSKVFHLIETNKERLQIEDYSFSQATLERVFLELFKLQMEDESDGDLNLLDVLHPNLKLT